jgi:hypothetical protein
MEGGCDESGVKRTIPLANEIGVSRVDLKVAAARLGYPDIGMTCRRDPIITGGVRCPGDID